jgi:hypothetical protein
MDRKNIIMFNVLVFPCGSEVALEIHRSLRYSTHVSLYGGNSVNDHGKFVYENYIGGLPFIDDPFLIQALRDVVLKYNIDAIYPGTDNAITVLKSKEAILGCKVISPDLSVAEICLSKRKTYALLKDKIRVPKEYLSLHDIEMYPVFFKPEIGYGSRGVYKASNKQSAERFILENFASRDGIMLLEYIPGEEYTVDCFTDKNGILRFCSARTRNRVLNGISVNTSPVKDEYGEFLKIGNLINEKLSLRGAWFYQVKRDENKELVLLEIASRMGGSSGLYRNLGVNFALLSVFDAFDCDVDITVNDYDIELDRALSNCYNIQFHYECVYVDFDDCLIINEKVNEQLVAFLYQSINENKKIVLLTKHAGDIHFSLKKYRLSNLFDEVVWIEKGGEKYKYINEQNSVFIDDSYQERKKVRENKGIPVFSPDMIESLLKI